MGCAAQCRGVGIAGEKVFAALAALRPVIIKPHGKVWIGHLDGGMEQIPDNHPVIAFRAQGHGEMVDGVAGCGKQAHMIAHRIGTGD